MNVSIGKRWEAYIAGLLEEGRYASASEIMREGLRLVEEREQKLSALRETIEAAVERGGAHSSEDVMRHARTHLDRRRSGKAAA